MKPLLVFEDISAEKRSHLFTFAGVRIQATRYAWISVPMWILFGLFVAFAGERKSLSLETLWTGFLYGGCLYLANVIHSVGHIVAGKIVHSPMEILLLTSLRDVTLYAHSQASSPKRVRILRSLGGPVLNLAAGLIGLGVMALTGTYWVKVFAVVNCGVGLWTLCPVPTMDGWVIWTNLFRSGPR